MPQIEAFLDACADSDKADRRIAMIIARTAQAEDEDFKKALKELN